MPLSIFSMCSGFVGTLLVKNFTLFDNRDLFAVTNEQFSELLLTLCMGLHTRLGKLSPLHFETQPGSAAMLRRARAFLEEVTVAR